MLQNPLRPLNNPPCALPGSGQIRAERPVSPCLGPVSQGLPAKLALGDRSLLAWDRSLPAETRSGTGLISQGPLPQVQPQHTRRGTGLSHQGPVPESETLRT
uniref:Uncharacterized protein n=1 Tax=Ananas comosus var. bracteatus TaxID=296719 RepID=A0A6V7QBH7_ANACO|nr:unnamed protein product [Ananas comosus var. bracteatus]